MAPLGRPKGYLCPDPVGDDFCDGGLMLLQWRLIFSLIRTRDAEQGVTSRADEWNVNKWAWEGALKVASKGEECIIKLEDKSTGELYARAFLREGEPHPVEAVIDSSRYLNKKKTAEEMVQHYENTSSVDYSLKEGETLVLQLKNKESGSKTKSAFFEQGLNKLSFNEKANTKEATVSLKLPPPPPSPVSPTDSGVAMSPFKAEFPSQEQPGTGDARDAAAPFKAEFPSQEEALDDTVEARAEAAPRNQPAAAEKSKQGSVDDEFDFGDFQAAA
uniref:NECAP PHear domain-containing protein n=1 Tax=Aegilops tauschii TaxID=37682 RepID=R7W3C0_AEGTA